MKRIISSILCIIIVFSLCFTSGYAAVKTESDDIVETSAALLKYLGIMEYTDDGSGGVTRADFACYVSRALGVSEYSGTSQMLFKDVPKTHWAASCVNYLAGLGAIYADGKVEFRPNDMITLNEATKILISVLGYDVYANVNGGYPVGYLKAAGRLGIHDGVSGTEYITAKDASIMIANALSADMYVEVTFGGENDTYKQSSEDTILSTYHNIYYTEGIVDATENTSLTSATGVGEDKISIDGATFICEGNNFNYLGMNVGVYYRQDKIDGIGEVVMVVPMNKGRDIITITDDMLLSFDSSYTLSYYSYDTNKSTKINIPKTASFIYNGVYVNKDIVDYVNIDYGEIKLIAGKAKAYDTVIITEYETVVAGYVDAANGYVYSNDGVHTKYDLSDESGEVYVFDDTGAEISVGSIVKNDVLAIAKGNGVISVYVSRKSVSGIIETTSVADDAKITIDGKEYICDKEYYNTNKKTLTAGSEVTVYLDMRGRVAYHRMGTAGELEYGYLINAKVNDDFVENLDIKLVTTDGEMVKLKADEKIKIDGNRCDDFSDAFSKLCVSGTTTVKPQLIRFRVNDDENIIEIDTPVRNPEKESEDTLRSIAYTSDGEGFDYIGAGILGKKIAFDSSTILFKVPKDNSVANATEKMFTVTNLAKRIDWLKTEIEGFTANTNNGAAEVVVQKLDFENAKPEHSNNLMIEEISNVLDDEGYVVEHIVGWRDGSRVEYDVDEDISIMGKADKGDLVVLAVNAGNVVTNYELVYDASSGVPPTEEKFSKLSMYEKSRNSEWGYFGKESLRFGYVSSVKGNVVSTSYSSGGAVEEVYPVGSIAATIFDGRAKDGLIYKGGLSDIADYETAGSGCSKIIVYAEYGQWKSYYVYK